MNVLSSAAPTVLMASWLLFSGMLAWNHIRVRRERRRKGIPEEKPALRDPRSMHGLALEGASFLIAALFRQPSASDWRAVASMLAGFAAVAMLASALRALGLEWRIKAVVTEDHRLVTTGAYAMVRHPVFTALLCLLLSTVFLVTRPWAAAVAVAVYVYGTSIRVKAEDRLLEARFGQRFRDYKARVPAYCPGLAWLMICS